MLRRGFAVGRDGLRSENILKFVAHAVGHRAIERAGRRNEIIAGVDVEAVEARRGRGGRRADGVALYFIERFAQLFLVDAAEVGDTRFALVVAVYAALLALEALFVEAVEQRAAMVALQAGDRRGASPCVSTHECRRLEGVDLEAVRHVDLEALFEVLKARIGCG